MRTRWSPYGFVPRALPLADLQGLLEAARWSPSSYNEQPWRLLVARRDEAHWTRALTCLVEFNRSWARHASVLVIGVVARRFADRDAPNPAAEHDLGLATAHMMLEASARGIASHAMIGIDADHTREVFAVPQGFDPLTAIAFGFAGSPPDFPDKLRDRDAAPRQRHALSDFVYGERFGSASSCVDD